jgi:hypothetical protein
MLLEDDDLDFGSTDFEALGIEPSQSDAIHELAIDEAEFSNIDEPSATANPFEVDEQVFAASEEDVEGGFFEPDNPFETHPFETASTSAEDTNPFLAESTTEFASSDIADQDLDLADPTEPEAENPFLAETGFQAQADDTSMEVADLSEDAVLDSETLIEAFPLEHTAFERKPP